MQAHPKRADSTRRYDLLNATPTALVLLDAEGRIACVNDAGRSLLSELGIDDRQLHGTEFHRLTGPPFASVVALSAGRLTISIGGETLGAVVAPARLEDREAPGAMVTLTPISAQQRLKLETARIAEAVAGGAIDVRVPLPLGSPMADTIAQHYNACLDAVQAQLTRFDTSVDKLRECDFDIPTVVTSDSTVGFGKLQTGLAVTVANLTESIRQTLDSSATIADTAGRIAEQNNALAERTTSQADYLRRTSSDMEQLNQAVAQAAQQAATAAQQGQLTTALVEGGRTAVSQVLQTMDAINASAVRVDKMLGLINDIAFQTNILAINAAVEAAHAGESGRGFAVVAQEVRMLAARSADAANQIRAMVATSREISGQGKSQALDADRKMLDILQSVAGFSAQISAISQTASEQTLGLRDASEAIARIDAITQQNNALVADLATNANTLDRQAKHLMDAAKVFRLPKTELSHPLHQHARDAALWAAAQIGELFDNALTRGMIEVDALFSDEYTPIGGTDPVKFHTPFDALCDNLLPAIQEQMLETCPEFIYAIAADQRGYVPTHNARFSKPLTRNYQTDLAGNRTKRIFDDRVGQQVGTHTQTWKLQTYRRDTGELMFDMSAPIHAAGRHWGGFRIGYRIA
ncbi:MAG: methyl-accepting chemotaxis protein [Thiotrichales bacterium]